MEIVIEETKQIKQLSIIDPKSGVNWASDLVGNHIMPSDYQTNEDGVLIMDEATYDWWYTLCSDLENAEARKAELLALLHDEQWETACEMFNEVGNCDLEDTPPYTNVVCDEIEALYKWITD